MQEIPELTQRDLVEKVCISVCGLNYSLKARMEKGSVKIRKFATSKDKFGYVYVLTPNDITKKSANTDRFLRREIAEYEALKAEIDALTAEPGHGQSDGLRRQAK
jgi:EPS-associated MarR family transcriptional regulator